MATTLLLALLLLLAPNVQSTTRERTLTALTEFKRQILDGGARADELLASWRVSNSSASYCDWEGVSCDSSAPDRVLGISLPGLGLQGTIAPALSNLTFLLSLDLSQNAISGGIPPLPLGLQFLTLASNNLSGSIPATLGDLANLDSLDISGNAFTGTIPIALGRLENLQILDISNNSLTGGIPPSLSSLRSLIGLNLAHNHLSGVISSELANCTMLQALNLAQNNLSGSIPAALGGLSELQMLALWSNNLTGSIPVELGNCSSLVFLDLSSNGLTGAIPHQMGSIPFTGLSNSLVDMPPELEGWLSLHSNSLSGNVPPSLGNCSGVRFLYLNFNKLQGSIPHELGKLTNLQQLYLTDNWLAGRIPPTLGDLILLQELALNYNMLNGIIPESFSNLTALTLLDVGINELVGSIPQGIGALAQLQNVKFVFNNLSGALPPSLANCTQLLFLEIDNNQFSGPLPPFIAGFPHLCLLNVSVNHFSGHLPETFANASAIFTLFMAENDITGTIPSVFGRLPNLQRLDLHGNQLHGPIPAELGNAGMLSELNLQGNRLEGALPPQLGKLSFLQYLYLQGNALQGSIPESLGECHKLLDIDLSYNNFSGSIPLCLLTLPSLQLSLALSHNSFTGSIPDEISNLQSVQVIDFSHNQLHGGIPTAIVECNTLQTLNLSHNKLQGQIPAVLGQLKSLASLDLSANNFTGQIPNNLSKFNFTAGSFGDNPGLCGPPLGRLCHAQLVKSDLKNNTRLIIAIIFCVTIAFLIIICGLFAWRKKYGPLSTVKRQLQEDSFKSLSVFRVTTEELEIATGGFSEGNLIGTGGTSKVYKGVLKDGLMVAVKKFSCEGSLEKAHYFFRRECETLGKLRHRNLVRILSTCCNLDMKAIVLEYMSNGSLEKLLFESEDYQLDCKRLVDIALDVAQALEYLHHDCDVPVIHCDLKPSNILLDKFYTAHVSDFGIARLLGPDNESYSASYFKGSFGYIAPECAELAHYSLKGDIYSYGVVLLCMLTGRKPTSELFYEQGTEMPNWARRFWPDRYMDALHPTLRRPKVEEASKQENEVLHHIMEVALCCTAQAPKHRPTSKEIVRRLSSLKSSPKHLAMFNKPTSTLLEV